MSWSDSFGLDANGFGVDDDADAADATPPVVGEYDPAPGTKIGPTQPLSFSVTDDSGSFAAVLVAVAFPTGVAELVHDNDGFLSPYGTSVRAPITGGYRYTLRRSGGWPASPTVRTIPVDARGNKV
jgi:hypothetical protein